MARRGASLIEILKERIPAELWPKVAKRLDSLALSGVRSVEDLISVATSKRHSPQRRLIACWALGYVQGRKVLGALLSLLTDDSEAIVWEAASALGKTRNREAVTALIAELMHSPHRRSRAAACHALGMISDRRAVGPLIARLRDVNEDAGVRGEAAEALGYLRDRRAVPALLAVLGDRAAEVRFWAAFALGQLGDKRAIPALRRVARVDTGRVRRWGTVKDEAVDALRQIEMMIATR